jgi:hypothetical protein
VTIKTRCRFATDKVRVVIEIDEPSFAGGYNRPMSTTRLSFLTLPLRFQAEESQEI